MKNIVFYIILAIVFFSPIVFYILQFWQLDISKDPNDWAVFGNYIGGIYSIFSSIVIFILGYKMTKVDEENNKRKKAVGLILEQIGKIKNSKNKVESITKLQNLIISHRVFVSDNLFYKLRAYADNYLSSLKNEQELNISLEEEVTRGLKKIYG